MAEEVTVEKAIRIIIFQEDKKNGACGLESSLQEPRLRISFNLLHFMTDMLYKAMSFFVTLHLT